MRFHEDRGVGILPRRFVHQLNICDKIVGPRPGLTLLCKDDALTVSLRKAFFIEQQRLPQLNSWPEYSWNIALRTYKHHRFAASVLITAFELGESILIADEFGVETEVMWH